MPWGTLQRKENITAITVINGVNTLTAALAGQTVGNVRAMLIQALNIAPDATPVVSGTQVQEDYLLQDGDELEFVKPSGDKGN